MEEGCEYRQWDELIPDALGLIFRNLSLQEKLTVVPRVCKAWGKAVKGPYCWLEIDIAEWCRYPRSENLVDRMIRLLISRSCGSLRKLSISGLSNQSTFQFIGNNAKSLQSLWLQQCTLLSDSVAEQVFEAFSNVTYLDISYCTKIGARGLEAIGNHCKSLTGLRRRMHPLEVIDKQSQDDEALAIAATMPKLKQLEIAYMKVETLGIVEVLKRCTQLELLDIRGCWYLNFDAEFFKKYDKLKVVGPVVDKKNKNGWDDCSDYSGSSGYLPWDFVAGDLHDDDDDTDFDDDEFSVDSWEVDRLEEDVELWFYDDLNAVDAGYDWPQSP